MLQTIMHKNLFLLIRHSPLHFSAPVGVTLENTDFHAEVILNKQHPDQVLPEENIISKI